MKANDLVKGDWVLLRNGWLAQVAQKRVRGNTPMLKVYGFYTEIGSCYVWDIAAKIQPLIPIGATEFDPR